MSSFRNNRRGRNPWRRGYCDWRQPPDGHGSSSFVSGDSHLRAVTDANSGHRQGYMGNTWAPRSPTQSPFRPRNPEFRPPPYYQPSPPAFNQPPVRPRHSGFRPSLHFQPSPPPSSRAPPGFRPYPPPFRSPGPPPRPADYRNWVFSDSQPPPQCEKFTVLSYNVLADYLAIEHRPKLYFHIPRHILDWEWRRRRLLLEFGLWAPDIMCLQEVDHFHDLDQELASQGYTGIWKMRTGNAVDGCAIFWKTNRFQLRHEENIEYNKIGLRDNVAQIVVLESRTQNLAETSSESFPGSSDQLRGVNQIVVCNIHVLYNPKRGEIKLGQVRVLLDRACAVSRYWGNAPVVICGDFNCTPESPLYNYLSEQKLCLSRLARNQVSGQYSGSLNIPQPYAGSGIYRGQPPLKNSSVVATRGDNGRDYLNIDHNNQNCMRDISLAESPLPAQVSTEVLDVSSRHLPDDRHKNEFDKVCNSVVNERSEEEPSNINSGKFPEQSFLEESNETVEGSNQPYGTTLNAENNEQDEYSQVISSYSEHSSVGSPSNPSTLDEHLPQSNSNANDKLIGSLDLGSSCRKPDVSQKFSDSPAELRELSDFHVNISNTSAYHGSTIGSEVREEGMERKLRSFEGSTQNSKADTTLDQNLVAGSVGKSMLDVMELSSMEMSSSARMFVSYSTDDSSADLTAEKNTSPNFSSQKDYGSNLLAVSTSVSSTSFNLENPSLKEVGEIKESGEISEEKNGIISMSGESSTCIPAQFTSNKGNVHQDSSQPVAQEGSQAFDGHRREEADDHSDVKQKDGLNNDICTSEESSDPNFFKELLGEEDDSPVNDSIISMAFPEPKQAPQTIFYDPYVWTPMEIEVASGNADCNVVEHNLRLKSAYRDVKDFTGTKDTSGEPQVTSYNRQFMGTVDYIWYSEGLQTVKVLDTIPTHVLHRTPGFPTQKWGSDHLALVCQMAFTKGFTSK